MADYKRMVSYLYKYRNGVKGENVGYVRVEKMNGEVRYVVRLRDRQAPEGISMQVCMYHQNEDRSLMGFPCGCMELVRGEGEFRGQTESNNVCGGNRSFEEMSGMVIYYDRELAYGTQWDGVPLDINQLTCMGEETEEQNECQRPDFDDDDEDIDDLDDLDDMDDRNDRDNDGDDYVEDLLDNLDQEPRQFRNINQGMNPNQQQTQEEQQRELDEAQRGPNTQPLWGNQPETERMSFQQIDRVVQNNPRLPNMEGSIIGIPGVYSRENEYLASLFGFKEFLPLRGMPVRSGVYGYWIRPLQD